jgi:drug/metabolite transporter (DMT)-like permease
MTNNSNAVPLNESKPITLASACLAALCAALWGGLVVVIQFTQDDLPPLGTAGLRFGLASLCMAAWMRWERVPFRVRAGQWGPIGVAGLLLFVQISLFHWGLTQTNTAHGAVLIGSNPVSVAVLAHFLLRGDRLTWGKLLGLFAATAGLLAVVGGERLFAGTGQTTSAAASTNTFGDVATLLGDAVVLASSILLGLKTVYTKHVLARVEPGKLLFWSYLLATAGFLGWSWLFEPRDAWHITPAAVWGLLYQGVVVAGFCFACWTMLLRRHRASQLAVFAFLQPLCGMFLGCLLRHDPLTPWLFAGGLSIAVGILLVTRS